jgi:hypothetical protein
VTHARLNGDLPRIDSGEKANAAHRDAASRRAALTEARRLAAHASRLQTRINEF